MRKDRLTVALGVLAALGIGTSVVLAMESMPRSVSSVDRPFSNEYQKVPTKWLIQGEMRFSPLSDAGATRVKVSATTAIHVANTSYSRGVRARVVFESLGSYVDTNRIVHDWVGATSWIPPAQPAYFIRLAGVDIASLGPNRTYNHHVDVIVSAATGREICAVATN